MSDRSCISTHFNNRLTPLIIVSAVAFVLVPLLGLDRKPQAPEAVST